MNKLLIKIITIIMLVSTLVLSGCATKNSAAKDTTSETESEVNNPSRFIMYNQDLTVFNSMVLDSGYYYIVDTYTDNVYVQKTAFSHVGIFPLYDENGNITKAKDMGITY
jgi:PBP1b-binding outer membrane lipoprotein LpoB